MSLETSIMPRLRDVRILDVEPRDQNPGWIVQLDWDDGETRTMFWDKDAAHRFAQSCYKCMRKPMPADLYLKARCGDSIADLVTEAAAVIRLRLTGDPLPPHRLTV